MKPKPLSSGSSVIESPSPHRRSKRLREVEDIHRRRSDVVIPPFQQPVRASHKKFARRGTFPLAALLSLEVPTREHLLPYLSLGDLSALELVNRECFRTIRSKRYWKSAFSLFVRNDSIANNIHQKCSSRGGVGRDSFSSSGVFPFDNDDDDPEDLRQYQRLSLKLKKHKQKLAKNIQRGAYKESSVCLMTESTSVSTDSSGRFVFAAGDNQVDIFAIAETSNGATLKLQYHLNWEEKLPDFAGSSNGSSHAYIIKSQDKWLFVNHYNGLVSIWNWIDQSLAHLIRHHCISNSELNQMPVFVAMECKQNKMIFGLWSDEPVTVWKYDESRPSSAVLISEIRLHGYREVKAIDFDAHLAAIAFDHSDSNIHHICIWDLTKNVPSRFITGPHVQTLSINAAAGKLLVGSTRAYPHSPVLQMYSLEDGRTLRSFKTLEVGASNGGMDVDDDFFLEGAASVWTDWRRRIILGFTNGVIAFYDPDDEMPVSCLSRTLSDYDSSLWINDISFDGCYLVFNQETDVCLFDFLKLQPSRM